MIKNTHPETKRNLIIAAFAVVILLPVILLTGPACSNQAPGEECQAPLSTMTTRYEWQLAWMYSIECQEDAYDDERWCFDHGDGSYDCADQFRLDQKWCTYWWARMANKIPLRECGITVINILALPDEVAENEPHIVGNEEDYDGDGISNYWEFWMGYNPCTKRSFGCSFPPDGSDDYDADGIIDSEDLGPRCNMDPEHPDPADYGMDCV